MRKHGFRHLLVLLVSLCLLASLWIGPEAQARRAHRAARIVRHRHVALRTHRAHRRPRMRRAKVRRARVRRTVRRHAATRRAPKPQAARPTPTRVVALPAPLRSETVAPAPLVAVEATPEPARPTLDVASSDHANLVPSPEPTQAPRVTELPAPTPFAPPRDLVRSVRFDVGYYYGQGKSASQLAEELTSSWASKGINLVYFYAFNRVYGARYYTRYSKLAMEDYGRQDLLKHLLREAHARGIKVVAWFYGPQSKQMWEAHRDWRQKTADGKDYRPDADSYPLCVHNPQVVQWWLGLIGDLLDRYPDLDGVDIAEAQIDLWGDTACHCEHCQSHLAGADPMQAWRTRRAEGLTEFILATNRLVRSHGKESHLTAVFTARPDGRLMTSADIRDATGFDLQSILDSPDRPDVIQAELIWQQWAALYASSTSFSPSWTEAAVRQAKEIVAGRSRVIAHIEATDFGKGGLDGPSIHRTVASAVAALPYGVDIYDAHLLESIDGASGYLRTAWLTSS